MRIISHKVEGVTFQKAHYIGGTIIPEIVVLHDTAGRLEKGNSAAYLASANAGKVSVHFVIERDGTVVQQVPTNKQANHAGQSSFHGRQGCNGFSLGIEMVNPGKMTEVPTLPDHGRAWWGEVLGGCVAAHTTEHGDGIWMPYSSAQMDALLGLLEMLFRDIKTLRDITTHWYISPGRKVDTNPLFPLDHVRARILGRDDPAEAEALDASMATDGMVWVDTSGSGLNVRRWPSFNPNIIASVPDRTVLPVLRRGTFDGRAWLCVLFDGREGWVVESYTRPVQP